MASRFICVFVLALCVWKCSGDTVALVDSLTTPYLKTTLPSSVSHNGFNALVSVLANSPTPPSIDNSISKEVDNFLKPDVFNCPSIVWSLALVGVTKQEFHGDQWKLVKVEESSKSKNQANFITVTKNCGLQCLADSFSGLVDDLGGSFESEEMGLNGQLTFSQCSKNPVSLQSRSLSYCAFELSTIAHRLETLTAGVNGVIQMEDTLIGLYFVRQEFGNDSEELSFALCFTKAMINSVRQKLSQVFISVLLHDSVDNIPLTAQWEESLVKHSRQLLSSLAYSDNDPTKTPIQKASRFSTNAVGYVMFLVILFSSLCSIYAMSNMDFTKDTLLYSQAKLD